MESTQLTSVKVDKELFDDFKIECVSIMALLRGNRFPFFMRFQLNKYNFCPILGIFSLYL